jgi:hypothetical protein
MLDRIKNIKTGPLRLLLVGSYIVLVLGIILSLYLFPFTYQKETGVILLDGRSTTETAYNVSSVFLTVAVCAGIYLGYWLVVRLAQWIYDGFEEQT